MIGHEKQAGLSWPFGEVSILSWMGACEGRPCEVEDKFVDGQSYLFWQFEE